MVRTHVKVGACEVLFASATPESLQTCPHLPEDLFPSQSLFANEFEEIKRIEIFVFRVF